MTTGSSSSDGSGRDVPSSVPADPSFTYWQAHDARTPARPAGPRYGRLLCLGLLADHPMTWTHAGRFGRSLRPSHVTRLGAEGDTAGSLPARAL